MQSTATAEMTPLLRSAERCVSERHARLAERLASYTVHLTILTLTLVDLLCVLTEILITLFESTETEHAIALQVLNAISLSILCIFIVEQCLHVYVFGLRYY